MKYNNIIKFIIVTIVFFCFNNINASTKLLIGDLYYTLNSNAKTASVIKGEYKGYYSGDIIIPDTIIYDGNTYIVNTISEFAFDQCIELTSIKLGKNITTIEMAAFRDCSALKEIVIPTSVNFIDLYAFDSCSGLEKIVVEEGNNNYDSRENCNAIIHSQTNAILWGCKNTVIPKSVTSIESFAFAKCINLNTIVISNSVKTIAQGAFAFCINLESVKLSEILEFIDISVFSDCEKLSSIDLPENITAIKEGAFYNSGLKEITIPNQCNLISIQAFSNCDSLESVTIKSGKISIHDESFCICPNLKEIICYANTPHNDVDEDAFDLSAYSDCVLKVPASAIELYKNAPVWKNFKNIAPIDASTDYEYKYVPLALEGNTWEYGIIINDWDYARYIPYKIKITGDSIIDGINYKKCYRLFSNDTIPSASNFIGIIRDDINEKKVYYRGIMYFGYGYPIGDILDKDILLYDFANPLNKDAYNVMFSGISIWDEENLKDSLVLIDGYARHRYANNFTAIIEGIGSCFTDMIYTLGGENIRTGYPNEHICLHRFIDGNGKVLYDNNIDKSNKPFDDFYYYTPDYIPIVKDGTIREYEMAYGDGTKTHYKIEIHGDTVINGVDYKKCYRHNFQCLDTSIMQPRAFMRETDKKVYCLWNKNYKAQSFDDKLTEWETENRSTENEILLYDFDNINNTEALVHADDYSIYSDYVGMDGKPCIINYYNSFAEYIGITKLHKGDLINPFIDNFDGSGSTISIGAVVYSDFIYFKSSIYSDWQYIAGIDDIVADGNNAIKMSVNNDEIILSGIEPGGKVSISDLTGRNILSINTDDNYIAIKTSELNPGCYIINYSNLTANWGNKVIINN